MKTTSLFPILATLLVSVNGASIPLRRQEAPAVSDSPSASNTSFSTDSLAISTTAAITASTVISVAETTTEELSTAVTSKAESSAAEQSSSGAAIETPSTTLVYVTSSTVLATESVSSTTTEASAVSTSTLIAASPSETTSSTVEATTTTSAAAPVATLPAPWVAASVSCVAEIPGTRALTGAELITDDMTHEKCLNFCASKSFSLAYITYGNECRCGSELVNGASLDGPSSSCNMVCPGAVGEACGGSWAFNLFVQPAGIVSLASDLTAKTAALPDGWSVSACIKEVRIGRALTVDSFNDGMMSPARCAAFAQSRGAMYAGLQNGNECWIGDSLESGASLDQTANNCLTPCSGDRNSICGGPYAISLLTNPSLSKAVPAAPSPPAQIVPTYPAITRPGWTTASAQCIVDVPRRSLTGANFADGAMTISMCMAFCEERGFAYAGLEYSAECFCGSSFSNGASLDKVSTQCTMACSGDKTSLCGGPDALQIYVNPSLLVTPPPSSTLPAGWSAATTPCIAEVAGRALTGAYTSTVDMTVPECINFCQDRGFTYAGLEYGIGGECFCGAGLSNGATLDKASDQCTMACRGDARSTCGGPDAIQLYVSA